MTDQLSEALLAMDRLNSWLRSPMGSGCYSRPKRAIYWLKGKLLNAATAAGVASHRLVFVDSKCRGCQGTGKWYSWDFGQTGENCRKCDATGKQRLWFVETVIDESIRWHSPCLHGVIVRYPFALDLGPLRPGVEETSWSPNQPGRPMSPEDVARDLNTVEEFIPERPGSYMTDYGDCDDFHYNLYVGEAENVCFRCLRPSDNLTGVCCTKDCLSWLGHVCPECDKTFDKMSFWSETQNRYVCPNSVFDACPFPKSLGQHPEIQKWQARQLAYRESAKENGR